MPENDIVQMEHAVAELLRCAQRLTAQVTLIDHDGATLVSDAIIDNVSDIAVYCRPWLYDGTDLGPLQQRHLLVNIDRVNVRINW